MTNIFQTLEDRENYEEIESHGPYFCSLYDSAGKLKSGIRTPWLGEGFYLWDTLIEDARWWGRQAYKESGYVICGTRYDQSSPLLFDMVGIISHYEDFIKCAEVIKKEKGLERVSFPIVLHYLKQNPNFGFKAIRVRPMPYRGGEDSTNIYFPGNTAEVATFDKVQICFFDKTLLTEDFKLIEIHRRNDLTL